MTRVIIFSIIFISSTSFCADAIKKPLYEFGFGAGGGYLPDYPGSNQSRLKGVPFPYFVYRGRILRSDDRKGTRARFLKAEGLEADLSFEGSFPTSSADNEARQGMPDMDWLAEAGPRVVVDIAHPTQDVYVSLKLPVRYVFSTDIIHYTHRGYIFAPDLVFEILRPFATSGRLAVHLGFDMIDEKLASYFYEVPSEYATAQRPKYQARPGYMGTNLSTVLMLPFREKLFYAASLQVSNYTGSANVDSPLLRSKWNFGIALGFVWVLGRSEKLADE